MCGIFGVVSENASRVTCTGLRALQHRGSEGAGISSSDGSIYPYYHKGLGFVDSVFNESALDYLRGYAAIGHVRYSTTGSNVISNVQPLISNSFLFSLAHNGNLINSNAIRERMQSQGVHFTSSTDTEVILHLMNNFRNFPDALAFALGVVEGSYSLLAMDKDYMIAARDPRGFRPLIYGEYEGKPAFSSETCAFDIVGGNTIREVEPGEMIIVNTKTLAVQKKQISKVQKPSRCVFEMIYFSRPDSKTFDNSVYETRKRLGRMLALEQPANADIIVPIPDSGIGAAIGYAEQSGMPFEMGIVRSHYGRTFIQPTQELRDLGVKIKLNPIKEIINGKRVVLVDDSLVRGTTSKKIIAMVREAGAKEIHFRVSSPATISPCYYGIDTPDKEKLIAANMSLSEVCEHIGADTLGYLSLSGLSNVVGGGYCDACFSENYPTVNY